MVEDAKMTKQISIEYIRLIYVNKAIPNVLNISMASNYYNGDTDRFCMTYSSAAEAMKSLETIANSINYIR